ncbi:hypothetical protein BDQ12DRAFT_670462 [Crucibulum laeve]|uniref:Uncharacterized protein n=1 Tax=Crucibulum laeve TaxID=68775 RepID=A0A5C3LML0_9AGAR|nr:hypothetical protein BDQ12DRAFT_670462 [Crucibulum laeve]
MPVHYNCKKFLRARILAHKRVRDSHCWELPLGGFPERRLRDIGLPALRTNTTLKKEPLTYALPQMDLGTSRKVWWKDREPTHFFPKQLVILFPSFLLRMTMLLRLLAGMSLESHSLLGNTEDIHPLRATATRTRRVNYGWDYRLSVEIQMVSGTFCSAEMVLTSRICGPRTMYYDDKVSVLAKTSTIFGNDY